MERKIAVCGFGNQARPWSENLRDSGWDVTVFLRPESASAPIAIDLGFPVQSFGKALGDFDRLALLLPDSAYPTFVQSWGAHFRPGQSLIFAHGYTLHFHTAPWKRFNDWILVAPKGIGLAVREKYIAASGVPAVLAVENDYTGNAWKIAKEVSIGLGCERVGSYKATVREEVEADLFSEQALLTGGLPALVAETYNTLVKNGFRPEVAYLECVHELGFMADLIQKKGIHEMLRYASPTARYGGIKGGARVITAEVRKTLSALLQEIQKGDFSSDLAREADSGFPKTEKMMSELGESSVEIVGRSIREKISEGERG